MNPFEHPSNALSRRSFLGLTGLGIGAIAAKSLMAKESAIPMGLLANASRTSRPRPSG